jgi:hypothetical protein
VGLRLLTLLCLGTMLPVAGEAGGYQVSEVHAEHPPA